LFTWRKGCFCRYANGDCLSWSVWIATFTTVEKFCNLYLNFINFKHIWYVYMFLKKIIFRLMLTLFLHWRKQRFSWWSLRRQLHISLVFETLDLWGFSERAKQKTVIAVWNDLDSERSLLLSKLNNRNKFRTFAHKNTDLISEIFCTQIW
jgi:hypothetical protein